MPRKKVIKTTKNENRKTGNLRTDVYNLKGEVVGKTQLPARIFAVKVSRQLVAQAVRVYQANKRSGTHDTKTRSEVIGSTRKIYRQKGTGRARHGAITAPIFIGGGVAHGPHPQDYSLTLPQKMKQAALFGVLTDKLQSGALKVVRGMEKIELKTKRMNEALTNLKLTDEYGGLTKILLVTSQNLRNIRLAGRNIQNLSIEDAKLLNSYQVISNKNIILMEEAVPVLAGHFLSRKPKEASRKPSAKQPEKQAKVSQKPVSKKRKPARKTTKVSTKGGSASGGKKTVKRGK